MKYWLRQKCLLTDFLIVSSGQFCIEQLSNLDPRDCFTLVQRNRLKRSQPLGTRDSWVVASSPRSFCCDRRPWYTLPTVGLWVALAAFCERVCSSWSGGELTAVPCLNWRLKHSYLRSCVSGLSFIKEILAYCEIYFATVCIVAI